MLLRGKPVEKQRSSLALGFKSPAQWLHGTLPSTKLEGGAERVAAPGSDSGPFHKGFAAHRHSLRSAVTLCERPADCQTQFALDEEGGDLAEQEETALEALSRDVSLRLSVFGGRVFAHNASLDNLNRSTIELKCWWIDIRNLFSLSITVGDEKHKPLRDHRDDADEFDADDDDDDDDEDRNEEQKDEEQIGWRLGECPIMLSIYEVDERWLSSSAEKNNGEPVFGNFTYYPCNQTADGVVNDKRPTVTAWIGMGAENFRLIRERLLGGDRYDFELGITVQFPRGSMHRGWMGREVRWDGKKPIPIRQATLVWMRDDWDADFDKKLDERPSPEPESVPPCEHAELMQATSRLETALARLVTPLWLTAAAVIFALFLRSYASTRSDNPPSCTGR